MIYPTARAVALVAAGAPVALLVGVLRPELWYAGLLWIVIALALIAFDALSGIPPRAVEPALRHPHAIAVGEAFAVEIGFAVPPQAAPHKAEVALGVDARLDAGGRATAALVIDKGRASASLPFTATRRGPAAISGIWLRWQGALGLVWKQRVDPLDARILVTPDVRPVREEGVRLFMRDALHGLMARLDRGEGSEFQSLVEFSAGMDRRAIDWKQSARHSELLAKEFRTERNNQIVLAIDAGRGMVEPLAGVPRLDRAVSAALLTAYVALKVGDRVSLFGFAAKPQIATAAMTGASSFAALQRHAARIDYAHEETNYTLALSTLAARLDRRSLIVVFTDFTDPTSAELMVRAVGRLLERHIVLFVAMQDAELESFAAHEPNEPADVSRAITAAALLRERRIVTARLRRLGVHVIEAPHDRVSSRLLDGYLMVKRRHLL